MPMYQFACRECGQAFDKQLRMSQASQTQECPNCGSLETRKVISAIAVGGTARVGSMASAPPVSSPFS